jgi:hypothetical protein
MECQKERPDPIASPLTVPFKWVTLPPPRQAARLDPTASPYPLKL